MGSGVAYCRRLLAPPDARADIGRGRGATPDGEAGELHQPHEARPYARGGKAKLRDSNPAPQLCRRIRSPPVGQHGGQTRLMRIGITGRGAGLVRGAALLRSHGET